MKKILSLLVLMAAFCVVGFAQSAPKTAKKAMLMGDNAQVKDVKTGQVLRIAKARKPASVLNGTIQMSKNGVSKPSNNTTKPANKKIEGFKYMKDVREMAAPVMQVKEGTETVVGEAGEPASNMKEIRDANSTTGFKEKSTGKVQQSGQKKGKKDRAVPQNAIILEKQ